MNRKQRRANAHLERKLARKAGFPAADPQQPATTASPDPESPKVEGIPEPGAPFPSLSSMTPKPQPLSESRLKANRENAQRSTGAKTESGRTASSQNRTVHGLARHNGNFKLLPAEDPAGFEALNTSLFAEHQPCTETEFILVREMAESHWLAKRSQSLQDTCLDETTGQITDPKLFSLYLRYHTTHMRAFHKCLNDLIKLRTERRKSDLGFEAQRIQSERHEMKKQSHYWDVLKKDGEACHRISLNTLQNLRAQAENPGFEAQYTVELGKRGLKQNAARTATAA